MEKELEYKFADHDGYGQVGHVIPSHVERANSPFLRRISFNEYSNEHYVAISKYESFELGEASLNLTPILKAP